MKSKVKVIFLFWTNGLSTSHHILIVHCASSKDSFSADHSSSLHSGAFTWLRFSASLKVLVWARRFQIYLSAPCGGCLCLQFPNAANLCESSLKVFQCHKPKILIQNIVHKGGRGGDYPPNPPKAFRQKYCPQRGEGGYPQLCQKKFHKK